MLYTDRTDDNVFPDYAHRRSRDLTHLHVVKCEQFKLDALPDGKQSGFESSFSWW